MVGVDLFFRRSNLCGLMPFPIISHFQHVQFSLHQHLQQMIKHYYTFIIIIIMMMIMIIIRILTKSVGFQHSWCLDL